jgi:chromosome partitioning related protein ParA
MRVVSVVSTKGGVGKTTVAANLGGLLADAGLRGARSVLLEMTLLASDLALSPITPEMLAARELRRGTV